MGITGAWISVAEHGQGIVFTEEADNPVTGREGPAQIIRADAGLQR